MSGSTVKGTGAGIAYVAQLHEIYRLSDALHRALTLEEIYDLAVAGVMNATGAARAAILLLDAGGTMRFHAASGLSAGYRKCVEGHSPWRADAVDPPPVLVPDVRLDQGLASLMQAIEDEGIRSLAFIPITSGGRLAGKFMVYFDTVHAFSGTEIETAVAVAHHVGFALERKQAENQLRDERQLFVDGPVVVFKWRAEAGWPVDYVSDNVLQLSGHPREAWLAGTIRFKSLVHEADRDRMRDEIWRHHNAGGAGFEQEYRIVRADGKVRWVRDFTRIVRDEDGHTRFFHGYLQDVTTVREAEDKLRDLTATLESRVLERTAALEIACRELEAFTYSVSHDLRAPLRWIDSYSALLREAAGPGLDADALELCGKIRIATARMSDLIDDLLSLSRISQQPIVRRLVDLSAMANEIAAALSQDSGRDVVWQIEPGLKAHADAGLLRVLLDNLLGNAWKFTSRRQSARIAFGARGEGPERRFFVRDDGAGFDMQYIANLFTPFQRLHSGDQFPGSGIGLATVARIVRHHGGMISAEAAPDQGACFTFSLSS